MLALLFATALYSPQPVNQLETLSWLTGKWVSQQGDSRGEEHWMPPRDGAMVGMFRLTGGGKTKFVEVLTIAPDAAGLTLRIRHFDVALTPFPDEEKPLTYVATRVDADAAVFANPADDVKRIEFHRQGAKGLTVRLVKAGRHIDFGYLRAP